MESPTTRLRIDVHDDGKAVRAKSAGEIVWLEVPFGTHNYMTIFLPPEHAAALAQELAVVSARAKRVREAGREPADDKELPSAADMLGILSVAKAEGGAR